MSIKNLTTKNLKDYDFILSMLVNFDEDMHAPDILLMDKIDGILYTNELILYSEKEHIQKEAGTLYAIALKANADLKKAKGMVRAILRTNDANQALIS